MRPLIVGVSLTTACNLACTYCHAIQRRANLPTRELEQTIAALGASKEKLTVVPFGGEPLVAWPALQRLVEGAEKHGINAFFLCTNGVLVRSEHLEYFARHNVELTLSWDGIPEANDRVRTYPDGRPISADIESLFDLLGKAYHRPASIRITVTPETAPYFGASVRHVYERLGGSPGVKVCFMPVAADHWTEPQLRALDAALGAATDAFLDHRRAGRKVDLALNECLRSHEVGHQILFDDGEYDHSCLWGIKMLGVATDGDVYPCHTMTELSAEQRRGFRLGHVSEGFPTLRRRYELLPPAPGNAYHSCQAFNLVATGNPRRVADVYRRAFRAFLRESVRVVEALQPRLAADARERAAALLARAAAWETAAAGPAPRPPAKQKSKSLATAKPTAQSMRAHAKKLPRRA